MSDSSSHSDRGSRSRSLWKDFLTPGWVLTTLLILLFAFVALNYLAPWQLGKNARTNEHNSRVDHALSQESQPLGNITSVPEDKDWTPVSMTGHFLPDKEALLRNRSVDSAPAFQVLTVFETREGVSLIVNRGWHPPEGTTGIPTILPAPQQEVTLTGYLQTEESSPRLEPVHDRGVAEVFGINSEHFTQATGVEVIPGYVQLDEKSIQNLNGEETGTEALLAFPLPEKVTGPYLSYGIQWIIFGILAPAGLIYFVRAELRERRQEQEEEKSLRRILEGNEDEPHVESPDSHIEVVPEVEEESSVSTNQEKKMAQRYGREGVKRLRRNKRGDEQRL